jgi:hypothetical protein
LEYLGVWGYLENVMLPKPKMRKLSFKIYDCDFIGFACNHSCYRFLTIYSDVLDYNIIIESKIVIYLEHLFLLKNKEKESPYGQVLLQK